MTIPLGLIMDKVTGKPVPQATTPQTPADQPAKPASPTVPRPE